uniref:Uncharacterized protein n=1 Tax=Eptatretus burgeri TaxID=7764 RepID=A0A8C4NN75_EPTBU
MPISSQDYLYGFPAGFPQQTIPMPPAEEPHRVMVDEVLEALEQDLHSIMTKDIHRKMVEVVAFKTFDHWWELRENKAKSEQPTQPVTVPKEEERLPPKETLNLAMFDNLAKGGAFGPEGTGLGLRGLRLPSFRVKRKEPAEPAAMTDTKRMRPSVLAEDLNEGLVYKKVDVVRSSES